MEVMSCSVPYIVAGPCSAESAEQMRAVCLALARMPEVSMVRCGVWKPRTRPGGFEGHGELALQWIAALRADVEAERQAQGLQSVGFCCEVARPEHVELAVRYGMEAVWLGARTTANPFMVQEVAEALRGTDMTVMVKNAPNPDVRLWMGALERCRQAGVKSLMAVHRGFDVFRNEGYRNSPLWEVPIELRRLMPDVPLLCDPSHIAGRPEPIGALSQTALDLGFEGLMIEVHPCPREALTDGGQQLTPDELVGLLAGLVVRSTDSVVADEELRLLREQIDQIDMEVLQMLAERFKVSERIAQVKREANLAVFQPKRWDAVLNGCIEKGMELGLGADFVKGVFERIHAESVRLQERTLGTDKGLD